MVRSILFTILLLSVGTFASENFNFNSPLSKINFNPENSRVMNIQNHVRNNKSIVTDQELAHLGHEGEIGEGFTCIDSSNSCSNNGRCNADHDSCICDNRYTTHDCEDGHQCCYHQKSFVAALVLQCIPVTAQLGIGFFIIDQIAWGLAILGLTTGGFIILGVLFMMVDEMAGTVFIGLCECAMCAIYIAGIVLIATGDLKDGNGVSLG